MGVALVDLGDYLVWSIFDKLSYFWVFLIYIGSSNFESNWSRVKDE